VEKRGTKPHHRNRIGDFEKGVGDNLRAPVRRGDILGGGKKVFVVRGGKDDGTVGA